MSSVESGKNVNVKESLRKFIAEVLETEEKEIKDEAHFVKDLGMDSMMALEILAGIEKKYKIIIPEDLLPKFTDLNATTGIVEKILYKK